MYLPYTVYQVRKILEEIREPLASYDSHEKKFPDSFAIGLRNDINLKDHLVRLQVPDIDGIDRSKPYGGKRPPCHLCRSMKNSCTLKSKQLDGIYKINTD